MLKTKSVLHKVILMVLLALIIPCVVGNIMTITSEGTDTFLRVSGIFGCVALVAAFYYIVMGYSKDQAWAFKYFVGCSTFSVLFDLIGISSYENCTLPIAMIAVGFGLMIVIALGKDLGKRNSLLIGILMMVVFVIAAVSISILWPATQNGESQEGTIALVRILSDFVQSIILVELTFAKYIDKENRKTT